MIPSSRCYSLFINILLDFYVGPTAESRVNSASLRDKFDGYKADIASLRKEGKTTKEIDVVFSGLCCLLAILIAILLEKTTKKTNKNSSIPPSQTGKDEIRKAPSR